MKLSNLHNHTVFSDGLFTAEEIIKTAISYGLDEIGISDHFFTSKVFYQYQLEGWLNEKWPKYISHLKDLKEKYKDQILVKTGIEIDSCYRRLGTTLDALPWELLNSNLDYVLLEYIGETSIGGMKFDDIKKFRKLCRIPIIFAHPDIDFLNVSLPIESVFAILYECNIAVEIPAGNRNKWFWNKYDPKLLENITITIGTDTHRDLSEVGNIKRAIKFIEDNGLTENILNFASEKGVTE